MANEFHICVIKSEDFDQLLTEYNISQIPSNLDRLQNHQKSHHREPPPTHQVFLAPL